MKDGLQIEEMKNAADSVVGTLKSLANTDRLLILCHLAHEELNVSQIEENTNHPTHPFTTIDDAT